MSETQNISMTTTLNLSNVDSMVSDEERLEYIQQLQNQTTVIMIPAMIFLIIVAFVGFIGNSLVLFVYLRKFQQNPTRILIMVIAMLDLVANVLAIPGEIYDMFHIWDFDNPALCQARLFVNAFITLSNAIALIVVAVVRYRKVCNPHGWQVTTTQAKRISVAVIFLGALISAPYAITNGRETKQTPRPDIVAYECSEDDSYKDTIWPLVNNTFFLILFIAAFLTLLILYLRIGVTTWRHRKLFQKCILEVGTDSENSHAERRSSACKDREMNVQNVPGNRQQDVSEDEHTKHLQGNCRETANMKLKVNCEIADTFNRESETDVGMDSLPHIQTHNGAVVKDCVSGKFVDVYNKVCETEVNNYLFYRTEILKETPSESLGVSELGDAFKEASKVEIQGSFCQFEKEDEGRPRATEDDVDRFDILSETSHENDFSCNVENQKYSTFDTEGNVDGLKAEFKTEIENDSLRTIQVQTEARGISSGAEDSGDYFDKLSKMKPKVDMPCNVLTQDQAKLTARLPCECIDHMREVSETELRTDSLRQNHTQVLIIQTPRLTCGYSNNNCNHETVTQISDNLNIKLNEVSDTDLKHDTLWRSQRATAQTSRLTCECSINTNNIIVTTNKDGLSIKAEGASKCEPQKEDSSNCEINGSIKYTTNRAKIRKIKTTTQTGYYHARTELVNRTTIIVIIISAVYCICFVPFLGLSFFVLLDHDAYIRLNVTEASFFNMFYRFYFINSAANPIVYNLFGRNFRQACRKLMRCR